MDDTPTITYLVSLGIVKDISKISKEDLDKDFEDSGKEDLVLALHKSYDNKRQFKIATVVSAALTAASLVGTAYAINLPILLIPAVFADACFGLFAIGSINASNHTEAFIKAAEAYLKEHHPEEVASVMEYKKNATVFSKVKRMLKKKNAVGEEHEQK